MIQAASFGNSLTNSDDKWISVAAMNWQDMVTRGLGLGPFTRYATQSSRGADHRHGGSTERTCIFRSAAATEIIIYSTNLQFLSVPRKWDKWNSEEVVPREVEIISSSKWIWMDSSNPLMYYPYKSKVSALPADRTLAAELSKFHQPQELAPLINAEVGVQSLAPLPPLQTTLRVNCGTAEVTFATALPFNFTLCLFLLSAHLKSGDPKGSFLVNLCMNISSSESICRNPI